MSDEEPTVDAALEMWTITAFVIAGIAIAVCAALVMVMR